MSVGFSKSICYPISNKSELEAVHGNVTYFESSGTIGNAEVIQEGIELEGLTVIIRRLTLSNDLILEVENCKHCFGLYFLLEGALEYQDPNDNTVFRLTSGTYLPFEWVSNTGKQKICGSSFCALEVLFTKDFLESLLGKGYIPRSDFFAHISDNRINNPNEANRFISDKLKKSLAGIINCPYEDSVKISYLECKTRWLLIDMLMSTKHKNSERNSLEIPKSDYRSIQKVVEYIEQNLNKRLTIKELSEVVGYNTTKLKSNFRTVHKTTIFKYITKLRMETAKTLILKKHFSITQASYEVGYSNPQHFTKAFKKTMGYLPSELKPGAR